MSDRRARLQGEASNCPRGSKPWGSIDWAEHEQAYAAYAAKFGHSQSAERLNERGGFGYWEITDLLGHEPATWKANS